MRAFAALIVALGLATSLVACNSGGGGGGSDTSEMSLGPATAKVTVAEYASLGCPICAVWNNDNFAAFKAKYIDTGKVHYVLKEMLTGDQPVAAAGFLLAHCAGKDKYFQVVDAVWRAEQPLLESNRGQEKRDALVKVAQSAGLSESQFDTCVNNDAALKQLNDKVMGYLNKDHIESTPTFMINGKICEDCQSPAGMDKAIAAAEAAK